jgi:hypothetical protein
MASRSSRELHSGKFSSTALRQSNCKISLAPNYLQYASMVKCMRNKKLIATRLYESQNVYEKHNFTFSSNVALRPQVYRLNQDNYVYHILLPCLSFPMPQAC